MLLIEKIDLFFKKTVEQKLQTAWSSLAQSSSPQSTAGRGIMNAATAADTFNQFKKQAKEKNDRVIIFFFILKIKGIFFLQFYN